MSANFGNQGDPQSGSPMSQPSVSPKPSSSGWLKGCLIAAAIIFVIVVVIGSIGGYVAYRKAGSLAALGLEQGKPDMMSKITQDVTPEQRAEFEKTYDQMLAELRAKGFVNAMTVHSKSMRFMQGISADGKITPDEVKLWVDEFNKEEAAPTKKK